MNKIHPLSDVQSTSIGDETLVWQFVVILPKAKIGKQCNINCHCFVENDVVIGDRVTLKSGVYVWDGITIEDDVFIGANVTFINDKNPRSKQKPESFLKTVIHKGASVGANSTIMGGLVIGEYAMVGAGSVVTKNIPANSIWVGNPAKHLGWVCNCGTKLGETNQCSNCGKTIKILIK